MIRDLDLKKPPSIAESIDWARTLILLGADDIDGGAWLLSGSNRLSIVRASGEGLRVFPGRDGRLYILFDEGANFVAGRQMTVQAWYRPVYDNV